jgi:hypothetical protein
MPGASMIGNSIRAAVLAAALVAIVGCDSGPRRQAVSGQVTLDGQPLDFGSITFVPDPNGPKASGLIEGGRYEIEQSRGPLAGQKIVEIRAPQYDPKRPAPANTKEKLYRLDVAPEALPDRYNSKSELRATVTEDGPNEFNFDLQSK